jgi:hypothetical protein
MMVVPWSLFTSEKGKLRKPLQEKEKKSYIRHHIQKRRKKHAS